MKLQKFTFLACFFIFFAIFSTSDAAYVVKDGKLFNKKYVASKPIEEHFQIGLKALENKKWNDLIVQMKTIIVSFPDSKIVQDAIYYLGIGYYNLKDYDISNKVFIEYLKTESMPKNFEEVWKYKLAIADKFRMGAKKHIFGNSKLPKLMSGKDDALEIYDEVIVTLPHHELAAHALLSKGKLLEAKKDFTEAMDAYQTLIKRFHKRKGAIDGYLALAYLLHRQSKTQVSHPDILVAAKINLDKFKESFPGEGRVAEVEGLFSEMRENKALGFYERGKFYEKIKNPKASVICYHTACKQFPDTKAATLCRKKLKSLDKFVKELELNS